MSWSDLRDFLAWLPPTGESAWYRARRPRSWWVTPELEVLAGVLHATQSGNWQRGGGKGSQPQPISFPKERRQTRITPDELARRRARLRGDT